MRQSLVHFIITFSLPLPFYSFVFPCVNPSLLYYPILYLTPPPSWSFISTGSVWHRGGRHCTRIFFLFSIPFFFILFGQLSRLTSHSLCILLCTTATFRSSPRGRGEGEGGTARGSKMSEGRNGEKFGSKHF